MKKLVSLMLCLCLMLGMTAALAENYTAEVMGKNDNVKVTVTYANDRSILLSPVSAFTASSSSADI